MNCSLACLLKITPSTLETMVAIAKTPAILSSEIFLKFSDYAGWLILLEGDFDQRFWTPRLDTSNLRPINCMGKSNVLGTLDLPIFKNQTQKIIALLDKDYDKILSRLVQYPKLVYTDENDLEVTLLCCPSVGAASSIERILRESVDGNKFKLFELNVGCSAVEHLRKMAANYGVLRLVNEQMQSGVSFDNLPIRHNNFLDHTSLQQNQTALHNTFVDAVNQVGKVQLTLVDLAKKIELHQINGLFSGWALVQGHDLMQLLAIAMNSSSLRHETGHRQVSEESLARDLCLMIHRQDLQATVMFQNLMGQGDDLGLALFR